MTSTSSIDQIAVRTSRSPSPLSAGDRFQSRGAGGAGNLRRESEIVAAEQFLSVPQRSGGEFSIHSFYVLTGDLLMIV